VTDLKIATNSGSMASFSDEEIAGLTMGLRGKLVRPGEGGYDEARMVYNGMFNKQPGAIIRVRMTDDVVEAVRFAAANDLVLAVRGGGHSVAGKSSCESGLLIDMSQLNGVVLDRKTNTVKVQGGATWGDVDAETQPFGLGVPGGVVSETGVAGLTLNGGIGWVRAKYGLSCDNMIGAEVVTPSGEVVTANAIENADLFWALRGGGGNFGLVTTFEFKVQTYGPVVQAAIVMYGLEDAAIVLPRWRDWVTKAPDDVTAAALLWTVPANPHMPPPVHGKRVLILAAVYSGSDLAMGEQIMKPTQHMGTPIFDMSGPIPFRVLQSAFDTVFPVDGTVSSYWKATYTRELTDDALSVIVDAGLKRSSEYSMINVSHMGNGVRKVGATETAYLDRDAHFIVSLDANWLDKSPGTQHIAWARRTFDRLQPFSTGGIYLNFLGEEGRDSDASVKQAFGANYQRLVDVKTKYDPRNLFRLNQNIKPRE
jgi:hypothetical protein